jgi:diguanylate cyclase (GGDEF)-like protein
MPRWRVIALATVWAGAIAIAAAVTDLVRRGFSEPGYFVGGMLATIVISYIYVIVRRHGEVQEAIDLSEAPIVALAILLPPGEALIALVAATVLTEIHRERALIKKSFNVAIRAVAGGVFVLIVTAWHVNGDLTPKDVGVVVLAALAYTAVNTLVLSSLIASVDGNRISTTALEGIGPRAAVWCVSVLVGLTAARLTLHAPYSLFGIFALLGLVGVSSHALQQTQREHARLKEVLEASTRIQSSTSEREQEDALLDAARALLPWRELVISATPPDTDEAGGRVSEVEGNDRWLIARDLPGSDPWNAEDGRILDALAGAAATALERAHLRDELFRQARLDPLTGVANRRHFDSELHRILHDSVGDHTGVLLIDLDNFKGINDSLGHDAGDALLQTVAARLQGVVRSGDVVARYGGDEFVLILPRLRNASDAARVMNDIQRALDVPVTVQGWTLPASASIGVAVSPIDGDTSRELLRAADAAMYATKQHRAGHRGDVLAVSNARHVGRRPRNTSSSTS